MKKYHLVLLAIALLFMFSYCSTNTEAEDKAQEKWKSILLECNGTTYFCFSDYNSVYNYQEVQLIELKNYSIITEAQIISAVEKLNGIEWVGKSHLRSNASRICIFRNGKLVEKWSPWNNWNSSESFDLAKINGVWQIGLLEREQYIYKGGRYLFKDCNELKKLVAMAQ